MPVTPRPPKGYSKSLKRWFTCFFETSCSCFSACCSFWGCCGFRFARRSSNRCLNTRALIPQKLIYVALQEAWKLQINHPHTPYSTNSLFTTEHFKRFVPALMESYRHQLLLGKSYGLGEGFGRFGGGFEDQRAPPRPNNELSNKSRNCGKIGYSSSRVYMYSWSPLLRMLLVVLVPLLVTTLHATGRFIFQATGLCSEGPQKRALFLKREPLWGNVGDFDKRTQKRLFEKRTPLGPQKESSF